MLWRFSRSEYDYVRISHEWEGEGETLTESVIPFPPKSLSLHNLSNYRLTNPDIWWQNIWGSFLKMFPPVQTFSMTDTGFVWREKGGIFVIVFRGWGHECPACPVLHTVVYLKAMCLKPSMISLRGYEKKYTRSTEPSLRQKLLQISNSSQTPHTNNSCSCHNLLRKQLFSYSLTPGPKRKKWVMIRWIFTGILFVSAASFLKITHFWRCMICRFWSSFLQEVLPIRIPSKSTNVLSPILITQSFEFTSLLLCSSCFFPWIWFFSRWCVVFLTHRKQMLLIQQQFVWRKMYDANPNGKLSEYDYSLFQSGDTRFWWKIRLFTELMNGKSVNSSHTIVSCIWLGVSVSHKQTHSLDRKKREVNFRVKTWENEFRRDVSLFSHSLLSNAFLSGQMRG